MSYASELAAYSRTPQTVVVIELDQCSLTFGTGACTATGTKCYKTKSTCTGDKGADFTAAATGLELKFSLNGSPNPFPFETVRPYLKKEPSYLPTELDPQRGITLSARVTLDFYDEPDNDIGIDPHVTDRTSYPNAPGTFWRKLVARNKYYKGRTVTIKRGFQGLDEGDYKSWEYVLDTIDFADDGVGMKRPPESYASDGFGLSSMRQRAGAIGGEWQIESHPGAGTRVSVRMAKRRP